MRKITFLSACFLSLGVFTAVQAQVETTSYLMNALPQYVNSNPAFVPKYKFTLGLPVISSFQASYTNNGFNYNDLVKKENGKYVADLSTWAKNLPSKNYVGTSFQTDLFRLGIRINAKMYFTLSSTLKGNGRAMIPKEMASLLVNGTSPYIGQTITMSPEIQLNSYLENAIGASIQVTDELRVGGRIKILNGLVSAKTETSAFGLSLNDTYQITATGNLRVSSSGLYNFTDSNFSFENEYRNYFKNTGWGVDLGATYKLMDKITLAASLVDIGQINWKNNLYEYSLTNASYTFDGIQIDQLLDGNSSYFDAQMDSLEKEFDIQEVQGNSFRTPLPGKIYMSGSFDVTKSFTVGALLYGEKYQGRFETGWSALLNKNFGRVLSTSVSYTISNRSFNNLGAGVSFNFAPFQLYVVGDNLLRLPLSVAAHQNVNSFINSTQVFTLRAGLNIVWGWMRENGEKVNKRNATKKSQNNLRNSSGVKARKRG